MRSHKYENLEKEYEDEPDEIYDDQDESDESDEPETKSAVSKLANLILCLIVAALIIGIIAAVILFFYARNYDKALDPNSTEQVEFEVPSGAGPEKIGRILQENGLIKDYRIFKFQVKLSGINSRFQAGTFLMSPSMTMSEITEALCNAQSKETVRFTIPEGYTIKQTAQKLVDDGLIKDKQEFYAALEEGDFDYWFVDELVSEYSDPSGEVSAKANRFEGFLFPDTYEIYVGSNAKIIINKMLGRFAEIFNKEYRDQMSALDMSVRDVIVVASLVEREVALANERAKCSSVVYNRIKESMPLQFCSSVQYILGDPKAALSIADTQIESPYNTYINKGLPPGPIANPGKAAIEAALFPEDTDYLYFVLRTKKTQDHVWTHTYTEFLKAKDAYGRS